MKNSRVVLGFSGGMDSATAVGILRDSGHDVVALTLDTFGDREMLQYAQSRAAELGVLHIFRDVQFEFQNSIIKYFANSYIAGRTPAPCTICNSAIKWRYLLEEANRLGIDAIATGHYFNIEQYNGRYYVARAKDIKKDQSYYLWGLSQQVLARALAPMGNVIKEDVKRAFSNKRESMGLCFLAGRSYREFMKQNYPAALREGDVVDMNGRVVGRHDGIAFYTIGQKRGLDINLDGVCIVAIDARQNRLVVGPSQNLYYQTLEVKECNLIDIEELEGADDVSVVVRGIGRNPQGYMRRAERIDGGYRITLDDAAWAPAVGQPVVFYRQNRVLGGGILERYY